MSFWLIPISNVLAWKIFFSCHIFEYVRCLQCKGGECGYSTGHELDEAIPGMYSSILLFPFITKPVNYLIQFPSFSVFFYLISLHLSLGKVPKAKDYKRKER